ncbi:Acyl dehydratase [Nitrosospira multiformis]|uniref:Acyl dehydratase n=3 Tax=Nitrosospira multiformis TaxID=1231 RepID=Q2YBE4_NITMU|nr:MaoC-like dehydratase [Nitrosospira multiformis ATCC 25196]SEA70969.1 Acyl dehydratase [Nitrosospira multiformis]SEG13803.1 Acyl dehydratase [Nitrosospira multiformis ATCC 25196]SEM96667.1 Acyl dehydratase [Nitrosospira multiformis]
MPLPRDAPPARYLDDMKVGLRFAGDPRVVQEQEIIAFARQFDPQPFHIDAALASQTLFGGLIASGWHTAAMTMRLLLEAFPIGDGTIGLGGEAAWPNPVRANDAIHIEGEVSAVKPSRSHDDRGIVTVRTETKNQNGDVVQTLTANLLVFRRKSKSA